MQEFDYIIVGAGSAGCVPAGRLSEAPGTRMPLMDAALDTGYRGCHAMGTCAMGPDDDVVNSRLRVRGVAGLRVADCSVMPVMVSGDLNGPMRPCLAGRRHDPR